MRTEFRMALGGAAALWFISPAFAAGESVLHASRSPYRLMISPSAFQAAESQSYRLDGSYRLLRKTVPALADKPYSRQIDAAAHKASLDPALVHAVIAIESGYRQNAVSPKGATGLMQVLPDTAARYGIAGTERSVDANLKAGTRYLRDLLLQFDNRIDLALAAYNAGEGAVLRYANRIPPYRETQHYVPAVMARYAEFRGDSLKPARIEYLPGTRMAISQPAINSGR